MNSPLFILGVVAMLGGLVLKRFLSERAFQLLMPEEKLKLVESFSRLRAFGSLPMIVIAVLFLLVSRLPARWIAPAYFSLCAIFVGFLLAVNLYVHRRIKQLGLSDAFRRAFLRLNSPRSPASQRSSFASPWFCVGDSANPFGTSPAPAKLTASKGACTPAKGDLSHRPGVCS